VEARVISFFVPGVAQTKGSAKAFMRPGGKFPTVQNDNPKTKGWQAVIAWFAAQAMTPKSKARLRPHTRPDIDKLVRAALDGLTGVCFVDDGQVVDLRASKQYGPAPGVHVQVEVAE
jgi:hypothetical protein